MMNIAQLMTLALLIALLPPSYADKHSGRDYQVTNIDANLFLLQGKGGNIALSKGKDGLLLIDDDDAEMSNALGEHSHSTPRTST